MNQVSKLYNRIRERMTENEFRFTFGHLRTVYRDWKILLYVAGIVTAGAIGFTILFFHWVQTGAVYTDDTNVERPNISTIDRQELTRTLEKVEKQETAFEELQAQPPEISSPVQ